MRATCKARAGLPIGQGTTPEVFFNLSHGSEVMGVLLTKCRANFNFVRVCSFELNFSESRHKIDLDFCAEGFCDFLISW